MCSARLTCLVFTLVWGICRIARSSLVHRKKQSLIQIKVQYSKEQVVDILKQVGFVTDEIPASVAMERINTLAISNECIDKVKNAYDYIIQEGAIK